MTSVLPQSFYQRDDVVEISRDLLGKLLCTKFDGLTTKVAITETEAYAGIGDKASHAYGDRRTKRTEPMYAAGGIAYVYLCYGIHHLFNVVTNVTDVPHAVLVRAGIAHTGLPHLLKRRGKDKPDKSLLSGPGSLSQALGIRTSHTGTSLRGDSIWIEDAGINVDADAISVGPRVRIGYAEEDVNRPYRFIAHFDPAVIANAEGRA